MEHCVERFDAFTILNDLNEKVDWTVQNSLTASKKKIIAKSFAVKEKQHCSVYLNNLLFNKILKFKNPQFTKDWANTLEMMYLSTFTEKDLSV